MVGAILDRNQTSNSSKEIQMLMVVIFLSHKKAIFSRWSLLKSRQLLLSKAAWWPAGLFLICNLFWLSFGFSLHPLSCHDYQRHHVSSWTSSPRKAQIQGIFCSPSSCVCHLLPPTEGRYWKVLQVILRSYRRLIFFIIIIIQICTVSIINYHQRFICASS